MGREASQVLSPPQLSCASSVIADAHRIRDEFFNTIGQKPTLTVVPQFLCEDATMSLPEQSPAERAEAIPALAIRPRPERAERLARMARPKLVARANEFFETCDGANASFNSFTETHGDSSSLSTHPIASTRHSASPLSPASISPARPSGATLSFDAGHLTIRPAGSCTRSPTRQQALLFVVTPSLSRPSI